MTLNLAINGKKANCFWTYFHQKIHIHLLSYNNTQSLSCFIHDLLTGTCIQSSYGHFMDTNVAQILSINHICVVNVKLLQFFWSENGMYHDK